MVQIAVSPKERGNKMSKFAKLVKSVRIGGGLVGW